jgi:uncharacterized membrane protein (GlpM family)
VEYIGVPIAVLTMLLAQRIEGRVGAAAAGWVAALPIAFGVASATIAVTRNHIDASLIAVSAAGHVAPMAAYGTAFVWLTTRLGAVRGFLLATVVYVAASVSVIPAPDVARIVIGVLAIFVGGLYTARQPRAIRIGEAATRTQRLLPLGSAALVVAFITVTNQFSGPGLAGAIGAFPTMSTTIALFIAHRSGVRNANSVMGGMVQSLPIYLTYCLVFALLIVHTTVWWAVAGATAMALVVATLTWTWTRVEREGLAENSGPYAEP